MELIRSNTLGIDFDSEKNFKYKLYKFYYNQFSHHAVIELTNIQTFAFEIVIFVECLQKFLGTSTTFKNIYSFKQNQFNNKNQFFM